MAEKWSVFLNGRFLGTTNQPKALMKELKAKRKEGLLGPEFNFAFYPKSREMVAYTDRGRARRPYIIVEAGKSLYTPEVKAKVEAGKMAWADLIKQGIIEYLDTESEENAFIAISEKDLTPQHTHLECDPAGIAGLTTSCLVYPEYNSAPRITMACQMNKQALGMYAINWRLRMDSNAHLLHYPQVPLVRSRVYDQLQMGRHAAGYNFVVAVGDFYGYNMEDAVIINKSAIERGLGRSTYFHTYPAEERRYSGGQKDKFEIPEASVEGFRGEEAYKHLGDDGIAVLESYVAANEALIGKTSPPRFLEEMAAFGVAEEKKRENSVTVRAGEDGWVDTAMITENAARNKVVKVRVRIPRIPEMGDKFASRHGQKGVIGLIVPQEDMPFTESGIVPDLILNPHAIPSRMTAGHILEMLGGKASCMTGRLADGTAFTGDKLDKFTSILKEYGFEPSGNELLYDGYTGKPIRSELFMGVVYYQKLRHLVSAKIHARSRGPVQMLTHQPTEGRAREGGHRFGEMERDCLVGYGAASVLTERLLKESDLTTELVCSKCGMTAVHDKVRDRVYCPLCGASEIHPVEMSYAFKLLLDEMVALGIFPRLRLADKS